jgi:glucose/arabinose dehydrogenase
MMMLFEYVIIKKSSLEGKIVMNWPIILITFRNGNYGSRIVFDKTGYLFLSAGEGGQCILNGNIITKEEVLLSDSGRVRNVIQAPDGSIYVSVENPGRIIQILPE